MSITAALTGTAALAGLLAGCGVSPPAAAKSVSPSALASGVTTSGNGSPATSGKGALPSGTRAASCVDQVFGRLTEAQRIGQLFLVGMNDDEAGPATAAAEARYHFGSVLFAADTTEGVKAAAQTTSYVQSLATTSDTGGVRFFVGANQEGGQVQDLKGPGFTDMPSAVDQGQLSDTELTTQATEWGR
ncbi:MAG TPA: hypothetical protein VHF26_25600, partial [Trebonia sp.]|nr:hypothetical protein [Trebonia sp.]